MIARLMSGGLPAQLDVSRAAAKRTTLAGRIPWRRLNRVVGLLSDSAGEVAYRLEFGRDAAGRPQVIGELAGEPQVICQRCLQPMTWQLEASIALRLVQSEAEEAAAEGDCLFVRDDRLSPQELIEDELLLALPGAPKHAEPAQCGAAKAAPPKQDIEPARRPFAGLAQLKETLRK